MRWLAMALVLSHCGGPQPPSDAGPPPVVLLGAGESSFTEITDGQTLLLARGCQGLQHVWITLRATDIDPRGVIVELSLTRTGDQLTLASPFQVRLSFTALDPILSELSALPLVVPMPADALGHDVRIQARITDRLGRTASDAHDVRIEWGTEICGG
jgi:hypothetical protein